LVKGKLKLPEIRKKRPGTGREDIKITIAHTWRSKHVVIQAVHKCHRLTPFKFWGW